MPISDIPGYDAFRSVSSDKADSFNGAMFHDDRAGEMASANFTYVLSGPPLKYMAEQDPSLLTPIGLLNNLQASAQSPSASLAEFGANFRQTVRGAPSYSATLQRVTSYSANVLGMLYRWAVNLGVTAYAFPPNVSQSKGDPDHPGTSLQLVTFSSDILDVPFGIYICTATEDGRFISGVYWENCLVLSKGHAVPAGEAVIIENVQLCYEREWPTPQLIALAEALELYIPPSGDAVINTRATTEAPVLAPPDGLSPAAATSTTFLGDAINFA